MGPMWQQTIFFLVKIQRIFRKTLHTKVHPIFIGFSSISSIDVQRWQYTYQTIMKGLRFCVSDDLFLYFDIICGAIIINWGNFHMNTFYDESRSNGAIEKAFFHTMYFQKKTASTNRVIRYVILFCFNQSCDYICSRVMNVFQLAFIQK